MTPVRRADCPRWRQTRPESGSGKEGMDAPYPRKLPTWDLGPRLVFEDRPGEGNACAVQGPHHPSDFANRLYATEALSPAATSPPPGGVEPYTLQWFLN